MQLEKPRLPRFARRGAPANLSSAYLGSGFRFYRVYGFRVYFRV